MPVGDTKDEMKQPLLESNGMWDQNGEALPRIFPSHLEGYLKTQKATCRQRLSPKVQELILLAIASSGPHFYAPAIWAHTTAALAAGATKQEIFEVCGQSHSFGVYALTLGTPITSEMTAELDIYGAAYGIHDDSLRIKQQLVVRCGNWPEAFTIFLEMDPSFFQDDMELSSFSYSEIKALQPKDRGLVLCALNYASTDLNARGTKIHIRNALKLGATPDEIIEMLDIIALMGIHGVARSTSIVDRPVSYSKTQSNEKAVDYTVYQNKSPSGFTRTLESFDSSSMIKLKPVMKALTSFGDANRHGSLF
jgi:alkylhydroperoxidase/carboxymuconolactone decarboxylase family protein YurZ